MKSDDPFEELTDECFICFNPCKTPTSCNCNQYVHSKCLQEFINTSGHTQCMVCLQPYTSINPWFKRITNLILLVALYLVCGIIGQFILTAMGHTTLNIQPPWSSSYFFCGIAIMSILLFFRTTIKKNTI